MTKRQIIKIAALSSTCALLATATAYAQDDSFDIATAPAPKQAQESLSTSVTDITVGIGGVSDSSAAYGRYNGMSGAGAGVVGGFNIQRRDAWDSGNTNYLSLTGDNLNFGFGATAPEASVEAKYGHQGSWGVTFNYDATTYFATDNFTSLLDKYGNLSPGYQAALAANGAYLNNSPTSTSFYGSYKSSIPHTASGNHVADYGPQNELVERIGTRRDKGTFGFSDEIGDWVLGATVSYEHKYGTLEQAMTTGGNNAGMMTFPMPINYDTSNYAVSAAYTTPTFQAKFLYSFSNFQDNNDQGYAFHGWNFIAVKSTTTPATYTSYEMNGVYSLPPSNQAHTFKAELGYNVDSTTRVYGTFVYGVQLQNDAFPAATGNGYVLANPTLSAQLASNPGSLDGMVQTFFTNLTVTSRPTSKLDLKLAYTVDIRDPATSPMWIYGDPTDTTALKYREAVPESWTKQEATLSAGYYLLPSTRLSVGYTFRNAHRGNAITHNTQDNEENIKLYSTLTPDITGWVSYTHANRSASAPDYSLWLVQIASDCGSTLATLGCQQVPFYEAARTQDAVSATFNAQLDPATTFSVFGKYNENRYHTPNAVYAGNTNPSVGITKDYSVQFGPDLTHQFGADTEVHVYYTFLRTARAMRALNNAEVPLTTPGVYYYSESSTYDVHTAGIGGSWRYSDQLKFGADYIYSYGGQKFVQGGSWDTTEAGQTYGGDPLLTTGSGIHQFKVHATYDYSKDASFYMSYQYDSLSMSDWALVGASAGQVLTGDLPPKYGVSTVMVAMTLHL